jgi:DNA-binding MarR family transcriptional regulator
LGVASLVDRKPILLDKVSFLVTRLLSVKPMCFSSLASALPVSKKKLTRVVKGLIGKGAIVASPDRKDDSIRKRGRPKVWLSLTEAGLDLFRRQLSVTFSHLNVLFGDNYLAGPWLTCEAYRLRYAAPSVDIVINRKDLVSDPLVMKELQGIVDRYYVWAGDSDPFHRGIHFSLGAAEAPSLAVEDLVIFTLRYNRTPELIISTPTVLSAAGRGIDYTYLHKKAAEYGILQEVAYLLDIACYLDPELQERGGVTLFARDQGKFNPKNLLPVPRKFSARRRVPDNPKDDSKDGWKEPRKYGETAEGDVNIAPYQWFWKIVQTPTLDEFIEAFLTYSSQSRARRLLDRLYDEGHWLLTRDINADLFKEFVER